MRAERLIRSRRRRRSPLLQLTLKPRPLRSPPGPSTLAKPVLRRKTPPWKSPRPKPLRKIRKISRCHRALFPCVHRWRPDNLSFPSPLPGNPPRQLWHGVRPFRPSLFRRRGPDRSFRARDSLFRPGSAIHPRAASLRQRGWCTAHRIRRRQRQVRLPALKQAPFRALPCPVPRRDLPLRPRRHPRTRWAEAVRYARPRNQTWRGSLRRARWCRRGRTWSRDSSAPGHPRRPCLGQECRPAVQRVPFRAARSIAVRFVRASL